MAPWDGQIIGETEKAWKMVFDTESLDGEHDVSFTSWVPKSVAETKKEYEKRVDKEIRESEKRYEKGKKRYAKMIEFAKSNGVKGVRIGLRKETILEKIKKAGLKYKY